MTIVPAANVAALTVGGELSTSGAVKIRVRAGDARSVPAELTVVPLAPDDTDGAPLRRALGAAPSAAIRRMVATAGFRGREGDVLALASADGERRTVVLIGLGDRRGVDVDAWRRAAGRARRIARERAARRVAIVCDASVRGAAELVAIVEGFQLAGYRFDKYKSRPDPASDVEELILITREAPSDAHGLARAFDRAGIVLDAVSLARDLVNEPAAVKTPTYIAGEAERVAKAAGFDVEVWGPKRIAAEELHGLIAVARGSAEEPRFLRLRYKPAGATRRVALVGKGITFDSGGLSLKQPKSMETMKIDMAGGATVLAVFAALGRLRPRIAVDGFVPLSENLPSGAAQKPGDVIRYRNGKTVEVLNTDAEGRLILADALTLAAATKPEAIIDIATLTGACVIALGPEVAGLFANDQRLADELGAIGRAQGEPLWQLPLVPEYRDDLKSPVADLKNVGGGNAGSITGALFLQEFVDGTPWAHLDIAGPSFADKDRPYIPRGGTGFAVRTLLEYLLRKAEQPAAGAETTAKQPAADGETTAARPRSTAKRASTRGPGGGAGPRDAAADERPPSAKRRRPARAAHASRRSPRS